VDAQTLKRAPRDVVMLHGAIARPQEALGQIGLLVLCSQAEGFGLVLIEAMAAGVPVVATDAPGIRDVVRHEQTGLLVPLQLQSSYPLLVMAIVRVIEDAALRQKLIENGLREVRASFSWGVVLPQYRALLQL